LAAAVGVELAAEMTRLTEFISGHLARVHYILHGIHIIS